MSDAISCPECGTTIEISEALSSQLGDKLRKEYEAKAREQEKTFEAKSKERDKELADREAKLKAIEEAVAKQKASIDEEVTTRLKTERAKLREEEAKKAKEQVTLELKDKEDELKSIREKLETARESELELRRKARELEEAQKDFDLTLQRQLDQERAKIRETAKKEVDEERNLKDAEKEKLIGDLKRQIDDMKRKAEQGSQQTQGEIFELALENLLRQAFPYDDITPVPKGVHGGDVVQTVRNGIGKECGIILWESKRTKNWSDGWLPKLRDDQRAAKAQLSVLVSIELPKGIDTFSNVEGVWVTSHACAVSLVSALRTGLIEIALAKQSMEGRNDKMEHLYDYLSGPEFKHRVDGIVEAYKTMRDELEAEKRAMQRIWAKREKQLDRALAQTSGMYGDLSGIIGSSLPVIEHLELPGLPEPD